MVEPPDVLSLGDVDVCILDSINFNVHLIIGSHFPWAVRDVAAHVPQEELVGVFVNCTLEYHSIICWINLLAFARQLIRAHQVLEKPGRLRIIARAIDIPRALLSYFAALATTPSSVRAKGFTLVNALLLAQVRLTLFLIHLCIQLPLWVSF